MKKIIYLIAFLYSTMVAAQQVNDLKLFRKNTNYYLINEKDTLAIINQYPSDCKFFNGKTAISSKGKVLTFSKRSKEIDLHLNYEKRTFSFNGVDYNYVIDYLQNNLVLLSGNKAILEVAGRNLNKGIAIHYYDAQPNLQLAYLAFMIKRDAKTKFVLRHSVYKVGFFATFAFSVYSLIYLVR